MEFKEILEDNISEYSDYIDSDVAENIDRLHYRGIAGHDPDTDSLLSLLIWRLQSVDDSHAADSELQWIYTADPSYISQLLAGYHEEIESKNIRKTFFEHSTLGEETEEALSDCGFTLTQVESRDINVTVDECNDLSIAKKESPPYIQSIDLLDHHDFNQGLMNVLFRYDDISQDDLAYLPKDWYEQSVSCYTKTDGKVTGLLLIHACPSGILLPVLFFAVGADYKQNLIDMLRFSIHKAAEIYPGNTVIRIHRRNNEVSALSSKFCPAKKGAPAIAGERIENAKAGK